MSNAREIVKQGQFVVDLAHCTEEVIRWVPGDAGLPQGLWDDQKSSWSALRGGVANANRALDEMQVLILADSTNVATTAVISVMHVASLPEPAQAPAQEARERYEQFLEQSNLIQELEKEIRRLGLDYTQSGKESSLSLLNQADRAFRIPSVDGVSPAAVLIPLREAMNRALADLLPKRPKQEEAGSPKDKVRSICMQCHRPPVDAMQIEQLAGQADDLNKELSGAKQSPMTRDQVRELMNRGLVFLLAFLRKLDERRFRA